MFFLSGSKSLHKEKISPDCLATCLYFLCLPFTIVTTPFGSLLKVITVPVIAVLFLKLFLGERRPLRFNSVHLMYTIYIIYILIQLFILRDDHSTLQTRDMCFSFFVILLITARVYNSRERSLIESTWILVAIMCIALSLSSHDVMNEFESRSVVYIFGYAEDPNQFCAYFIVGTMLCVERILKKSKLTPLYIVTLLLTLYCVLKTGSRGGLIGIVAGIVFCVFFGAKTFKTKLSFLLVGTLCAVITVAIIFPLLPEDVQSRYSIERVEEDQGSGRFEIWKYLLTYTVENPARTIHGSGLYSTYSILENAPLSVDVGVAHNQFVQTFADQGIIGMVIYLFLIGVCFLRNLKKRPFYSCAFLSIMAFSFSLTLYIFKPYINIIMMCAMNFSDDTVISEERVLNNEF